MCGCGRTSMPWPVRNSAGPIWSKKMNGPTICRFGAGSARRTSKPPRSRARGTISVSIASIAAASGQVGSSVGFQLMTRLLSWLQHVGPLRVPAELRRRERAERQDLLARGPRVRDAARDQRRPDALAAEGVRHLGVVDDDELLAGLREGHLRLVLADAVDVAALARGLPRARCRRGRWPCLPSRCSSPGTPRPRRSPSGRSRARRRCQCGLDRRALRPEPVRERAGLLRRADRVALAGGDQHAGRHRRGLRRPRDQRVHQHRALEERGPPEDHARQDVRAVRVAEADDLATAAPSATCASTKPAIAAGPRGRGRPCRRRPRPAGGRSAARRARRRRRAARRWRRRGAARAPAARTGSRCRRCRGRRRPAAGPPPALSAW